MIEGLLLMKKILKTIGVLLFLLFFYLLAFIGFQDKISKSIEDLDYDSVIGTVVIEILSSTAEGVIYLTEAIGFEEESCEKKINNAYVEMIALSSKYILDNKICSKFLNDRTSINFVSLSDSMDINNDGIIDTASCHSSLMQSYCDFNVGNDKTIRIYESDHFSIDADVEYNEIFDYNGEIYISKFLYCKKGNPTGEKEQYMKVYKFISSNKTEDVCYFDTD